MRAERKAARAAGCAALLALAVSGAPCPALAENSASTAVTVVAENSVPPQKETVATVSGGPAGIAGALARTGDAALLEAALAGAAAASAGLMALLAREKD